MKCKNLLKVIVLVFAVSILTGCSANRVSLVDKGDISIQKQGTPKVNILWADVYQKDGQNYLYAMLKQSSRCSLPIETHLDITVLAEDGSVQYHAVSDDVTVPANKFRALSDWKPVYHPLPGQFSKNAKMNITVHFGQHQKPDLPEKS